MKDPLQRDDAILGKLRANPFEILGLTEQATAEEIEKAFQAKLVGPADPHQLFEAKWTLQRTPDAVQRAKAGVLEYDDRVLARLGTTDPAALLPPQRAELIRAWDAANTEAFPDFEVARALGLCTYWSAIYATDGGHLPGFDAESLWRLTAMCWAMILDPSSDGDAVVIGQLQKRLRGLPQKELDAFFTSELSDVSLMRLVMIRCPYPRTITARGGRGMLEHVGWIDKARRQIEEVLQKKPHNEILKLGRAMLDEPGG